MATKDEKKAIAELIEEVMERVDTPYTSGLENGLLIAQGIMFGKNVTIEQPEQVTASDGSSGWAMNELQAGRKVRRTAWRDDRHLIMITGHIFNLSSVRGLERCLNMSTVDLLANDWELL